MVDIFGTFSAYYFCFHRSKKEEVNSTFLQLNNRLRFKMGQQTQSINMFS